MAVARDQRQLAVLDAPSNLGLRPPAAGVEPGVRKMPDALRRNGIVARLGAVDAGRVGPPPYSSAWDGTAARNMSAIVRYTRQLADRVGRLLDDGRFPVVLGGDCSILLGPMLALRRRGRFGLVFVDGHSDFRHPAGAEPVQAAAGEELALVTGRGDDALTNPEGRKPLVLEADVVALGDREGGPEHEELRDTAAMVMNLAELRQAGIGDVVDRTLTHLHRSPIDGFWIHLDADVLDSAIMPAVDSPAPGGLSYQEMTELIQGLRRSPSAVGIEVTIFDPDLDPDGRIATEFTAALVESLTG